jgi:hypothetical protein
VTAKRQRCREQLAKLRGDREKLTAFLLKNSGLPGRRANIELAAAFADILQSPPPDSAERALIDEWLALSPDDAPTNHKREFLVFCAVQALGVLYLQASEDESVGIFEQMRAASRDSRWRTREAACFAFQRIGDWNFDRLCEMFTWWMERANMADRRAILVSLAHPPALTDEDRVAFCLDIAGRVLSDLEKLPLSARKTDEYEILEKGLKFVLSVYVAASPDSGFRWLSRIASTENIENKKIIAANIRKSRLAKVYQERCMEIGDVLSSGF